MQKSNIFKLTTNCYACNLYIFMRAAIILLLSHEAQTTINYFNYFIKINYNLILTVQSKEIFWKLINGKEIIFSNFYLILHIFFYLFCEHHRKMVRKEARAQNVAEEKKIDAHYRSFRAMRRENAGVSGYLNIAFSMLETQDKLHFHLKLNSK